MHNILLKSRQGSVLVLAILIASILLTAAMYLSRASVSEIKSTGATDNSVVAFETAESGLELALKAVNKNEISDLQSWLSTLSGFDDLLCDTANGRVIFHKNDASGHALRTYELLFYKRDPAAPEGVLADCTELLNSGGKTNRQMLTRIRSRGTYLNTVRAVDAQVLDESTP